MGLKPEPESEPLSCEMYNLIKSKLYITGHAGSAHSLNALNVFLKTLQLYRTVCMFVCVWVIKSWSPACINAEELWCVIKSGFNQIGRTLSLL